MAIKRKFSPVRSDDKLLYSFTGDKLTVTYEEHQAPTFDEEGLEIPTEPIKHVDEFDFTGLPDGQADVSAFETSLPVNPFVSVKRVQGVLELELIHYHGTNASEEERFPKWEVIS